MTDRIILSGVTNNPQPASRKAARFRRHVVLVAIGSIIMSLAWWASPLRVQAGEVVVRDHRG